MKATICITIADDTSEEQMLAQGMTQQKLSEIYRAGFQNILQGVAHPGCRVELGVVVSDNTKEADK